VRSITRRPPDRLARGDPSVARLAVGRTLLDGPSRLRWAPDYPWGYSDEREESDIDAILPTWGDEDNAKEFVRQGFGEHPGAAPVDDPEFLRWAARFARFSSTPSAYVAFEQMWFDSDVRDVLPAIRVPTLVLASNTLPEWFEEARYTAERIPGAKIEIMDRPGGTPWVDDPEPYVSSIERFLSSVREEEDALDRVLATVLFTDIVGSTEKAADLGDRGWLDLVERHNSTVRAMLGRYRGTEMDTAGDGFFSTFDGPARAIRCALAIGDALETLGIEVRSGLHTGEVERLENKVGGITVNIGARICGLAGPSQVLVSRTVKDLVAGSGLDFIDRGQHELKGIPDAWTIYEVAR
jgi:class 3 adenylate cyclase